MGILHIIQPHDPYNYYCCIYCDTPIGYIMNLKRTGIKLMWYLFSKLINFQKDSKSFEIFCKVCNSKLGFVGEIGGYYINKLKIL